MMAKPQYITLNYPIKKIVSSTGLNAKLLQIISSPEVQRLMVDLEFLSAINQVVLVTDAIFDTGAPISLFPKRILKKIPNVRLIPHTFWGIVNKHECQVKAEIGVVAIRFKDLLGKTSPILEIPVAFTDMTNIPHLIGLKGIIEQVKVIIDYQADEFSLQFNIS
ncbi:MAG: hypothetical protein ACFFG0_56135 [Candidatus Thorarchaeota archaeon]